MPDVRRISLLEFAIAASVAIVPVLVAVLVGLGWLAPFAQAGLGGDRHASVRQVAALRTFEWAIVRRDAVQGGLPSAEAILARIPECAGVWNVGDRPLDRLLVLAGVPVDASRAPARRIASQLAVLDQALLRMSAEGNRRVADAVGFDLGRWSEAARLALRSPVASAQYPDRAFDVRCSDLEAAVAMLSRGGGRMLASLAWRGTEVQRTIARWRPDQYVAISPRHIGRANPWGALPGCVYLMASGEDDAAPAWFVKSSRAQNDRVCRSGADAAVPPTGIAGEPRPDTPPDDPRWQVPPSIDTMLRALEPLQRPSGALYRAYADGGEHAAASDAPPRERVVLDGVPIDVGFSIELSIDPSLQALAQRVAACYTGRQDVCRALGVHRAEDAADAIGHRLLERAVVRMAAIAIVDVESGRIEALAGAMSPCARQEFDGPGRAPECDARLPYPIRYRPDALRNAAVYHDAMPASIVKPVMAAAFLSDAAVGARWIAAERAAMRSGGLPAAESLRAHLMRSNSARFLDRMFCADHGFAPCDRPWRVQATAAKFGWNGGCVRSSERCGRRDLLFGRSVEADDGDDGERAPAAWIPYGRLLVEPAGDGAFQARAPIALDTRRVARCAAGADGRPNSTDDWEKCKGGVVVDVVAEGWGQGHARSTALGAAGMMATLAAAANGQVDIPQPRLVRTIHGVGKATPPALASALARWSAEATEPNRLSRDAAEVILDALSYSHRYGTARLACEQVFAAATCRRIDWIAGKTGTPTFPNDERSLDELAALCKGNGPRSRDEEAACGALRPYKWYVAAYRADPTQPRWPKAIGVLTERNWLSASGRVHGAGDHGPNPAAEIAFQVVGRSLGVLRGAGQ